MPSQPLLAQITNPALVDTVGTGKGTAILELFLTHFVDYALGAGGIVAFFMLLWGAIEHITAGGDKEAVQKSTKRITHGLVGLAILFSIFAIIFIAEALFGVKITKFTFPTIE